MTRFLLLLCGAVSALPQSLDGVWLSQGYGSVFEINGHALREFEITKTTCVQGFTAQRQAGIVAGREATFRSKDDGTFFVRTGGTADHRFLHREDSVPDIRIDRTARIPAVCEHPTANTPFDNFEVFSRTWAEHYISFELRHASAPPRSFGAPEPIAL
jgi:hypothetical protein